MTIQGHSLSPQGTKTSVQPTPDTAVFSALSKAIDFTKNDEQVWWEKTAPLLERIMVSADYTVLQRSQFLTLYRTLMIPNFGPCPHTWHASITHSGIPMEFSVNYQSQSQSTVRIGFEPVTDISGTSRDPYNLITVSNAMNQISRLSVEGFDPYLFTGFLNLMTLSKQESDVLQGAKLPGSKFKTQAAFGLDLKRDSVTVKCYIYPALKTHVLGLSFHQLLADAVQTLSTVMKCGKAVSIVNDYMEKGGCYNQYSFLGFDCIAPSKSRLKIYGALLDITWQKTEEIWTLGGQLSSSETNQKGLEYMRILWDFLAPGKVIHSYTPSPKYINWVCLYYIR